MRQWHALECPGREVVGLLNGGVGSATIYRRTADNVRRVPAEAFQRCGQAAAVPVDGQAVP